MSVIISSIFGRPPYYYFVLLVGLAFRFLQDEVHLVFLHMLRAVPVPRPGLRGVCVRVEQPVARRFRLGRLGSAVQLAPRPDGNGSGCAVRQR